MRTVYTAVMAALLATVITAGAKTMHGRHHRHHGHPATAAQRINMIQAFGYFEEERRPRWRQRTWNDGHLLPFSEHELWAMEHPDNAWMPYCNSNSYAECGRDSLKNRQNGSW